MAVRQHRIEDTKEANSQVCSVMDCLLLRRFKEAINECSAALNAQPGYQKALVRRSKAYENIGHFKQALSDIQKANKSESVTTPETQVQASDSLTFTKELS